MNLSEVNQLNSTTMILHNREKSIPEIFAPHRWQCKKCGRLFIDLQGAIDHKRRESTFDINKNNYMSFIADLGDANDKGKK